MRIVFMGSPEFSVPTLEALAKSDHEIVAVYSQPPRPAGRGKAERPTPVHEMAAGLGLEVRTPLNFKDPADVAAFVALNADIAVVIAYGLLLPEAILNAPRLGCVNLHASLLPRWRGAAPIHRAIMAGDDETGVCLMQMEKGLDTGPVLARAVTPIEIEMTTGDLHDKLSAQSASLLMSEIDRIETLSPEPQTEEGVVYAEKISKAEAEIDWSRSNVELQRHIHGLSPFPGAWSTLDGERIKFHRVVRVDANGEAGELLDDQMTIACGTGALRPVELQRAGKRAMNLADVLRGMSDPTGKKLG